MNATALKELLEFCIYKRRTKRVIEEIKIQRPKNDYEDTFQKYIFILQFNSQNKYPKYIIIDPISYVKINQPTVTKINVIKVFKGL